MMAKLNLPYSDDAEQNSKLVYLRSAKLDEQAPIEVIKKAAALERGRSFKRKRLRDQETLAGRERPMVCEACSEARSKIVFDHCHKNGHFRGWICDRCNRALGLLGDSIEVAKALIKYLEADVRLSVEEKTARTPDNVLTDWVNRHKRYKKTG